VLSPHDDPGRRVETEFVVTEAALRGFGERLGRLVAGQLDRALLVATEGTRPS